MDSAEIAAQLCTIATGWALAALARAAGEIGEDDEHERCTQFLRDSSAEAADELLA